jgi:hypothetical protein
MNQEYLDLLRRVRVDLEDRDELEARREATRRRLWIDVIKVGHVLPGDKVTELHVITPNGTCVGICHDWNHLGRFVDDLKPITLRKVLAKAKPCPVHPTPIVVEDTLASDASSAARGEP